MLWLRKRLDDQETYSEQNSISYLQNEMISFSDYIQFVEESVLNETLENDIKWKAFQLVDIYLRCMIIYKWLIIPTIKGKIEFFTTFLNPNELKEYVSFSCLLPSEIITNLPINIKEILQQTFDEVLKGFSEEYKFDKKFKFDIESFKTNYGDRHISYILYTGLWSALRILPKEQKYLGKLFPAHKNPIEVLDFIHTPICQINEFQISQHEIKDKPEFFKRMVIQSIDYYISLQRLYFEKRTKEEYLKQKYYFFEDSESDIKKQFIDLLQNSNFVTIKNNCTVFQDYCYILLKARILKYENEILQATKKDSWGSYYPGSFIHDSNLELVKHIKQINTYFMKLFDLKNNKDLEDKESYLDTNNGYKNLSNNTIIPKLNELKVSRK